MENQRCANYFQFYQTIFVSKGRKRGKETPQKKGERKKVKQNKQKQQQDKKNLKQYVLSIKTKI